MRRSNQEIIGWDNLLSIIADCKICRVATRDENGLYIVPMNFGYRLNGGRLTLFFHCARQGRKLDAFRTDKNVAFEMDCALGLLAGKTACKYDFAYQSITGAGEISIVEDGAEKKAALALLMKHQTGQDFSFTDEMVRPVLVLKLEVCAITGKRNAAHGC